jgi:hypothetical protein
MAAIAAKRDLRFRRRGISTTFDPFDGALTRIESDDEALASAGARRGICRNRARKILEIRFRQEGAGKAARDEPGRRGRQQFCFADLPEPKACR